MLSDFHPEIAYRSGVGDVVEDFYRPCLEQATHYRRAVGYFTSSGLAQAAKGLASLVTRGGKMRLVASPQLSDADIEALTLAAERPHEILQQVMARSMRDVENLLQENRLNALAWLSATGALEVKLALRLDEQRRYSRAIYHEKIGIFSDDHDNHIGFTGSTNETTGGLVENFESIQVFWSWDDAHGRVKRLAHDFESLWNDQTNGLHVIDFSETSRDLLRGYKLDRPPDPNLDHDEHGPRRPRNGTGRTVEPEPQPEPDPEPEPQPKSEPQPQPEIPPVQPDPPIVREDPPLYQGGGEPLRFREGRPLRGYQEQAIQNWFDAGGRGILELATGAGKTLTALNAINRLAQREQQLVVIITCPYVNLAEQWVRELKDAGIDRPIKAYGGQEKWRPSLEAGMNAMGLGSKKFLPIVVVNRTFLSDQFQALLRPESIPHLLVADEMHNLGAENLRKKLHPRIQYRLGLSATPERHADDEGTQALFDYFGNVVSTYGIADAIRDANLCPYYYYPILVTLSHDEAAEYEDLSRRIAKLAGARYAEGSDASQALKTLYMKRARLIASAEGKIPALMAQIRAIRAAGDPIEKAIIYCGDGQVEHPGEIDDVADDDGMVRQIESVIQNLGREAGLRVARFSYAETMKQREQMLQDMRKGGYDALVAIRCLDEGIDLPDIRMGFILASSTNPRQFIQRRGRLLRRADGKDYAQIWDFIVSPPDLGDGEAFKYDRQMVRRELKRVVEFCQTAVNRDTADNVLLPLRRRYNLLADEEAAPNL
jgi:superfamily II DNA or RNA helicase